MERQLFAVLGRGPMWGWGAGSRQGWRVRGGRFRTSVLPGGLLLDFGD